MTLLLDTHAVLWWMAGEPLGEEALRRIRAADESVVVSAASVWEAAIKMAAGKLTMQDPLIDQIRAEGFVPLSISYEHAQEAGSLPLHHRDPFDRMLIAQARLDSLTVVTRDPAFSLYDVDVLEC